MKISLILFKEINDNIKILKDLEQPRILAWVSETAICDVKQGGFLNVLLGTLSTGLHRTFMSGKMTVYAG